MAIDVNGTSIETTESGYLVNPLDWNEDVAKVLADIEGIELTDRHWDVIHHLRDEYLNNNQNHNMILQYIFFRDNLDKLIQLHHPHHLMIHHQHT